MLAERTWFAYRCISAVNCELFSFINGAFDQHMKRSRSFHSSGGNERSCISDPGVAWGCDNPWGPLDRCELTHSAETWSDRGKLRAGHKHTHTHTQAERQRRRTGDHSLKCFIYWNISSWKTTFSCSFENLLYYEDYVKSKLPSHYNQNIYESQVMMVTSQSWGHYHMTTYVYI